MASCSRCHRWRRSARRSTPNSIAIRPGTGPIFPTKASALEVRIDVQLFDRSLLYSDDSRFVLSGIINRMDRSYVSPDGCGEIRLIYRLTRTSLPEPGEAAASPRLPMTLNVVLKAKAEHAVDGNGAPLGCAEIARRWLNAGASAATGAELVEKLTARDGPLDLIRPDNIDRIETNLQIAHVPKTPRHAISHRLSAEGIPLRCAGAALRASAAREPDRSRPDCRRPGTEAGIQGLAARSRPFRRTRPRHGSASGRVPGQPGDCGHAGRV